ncbi:MAG: hypothetical protein EYC70_06405 [Planctomycetota bacterium]|nr:MAG: hypothetical protein EYC70_06405 [Planctomycetota bacterium]
MKTRRLLTLGLLLASPCLISCWPCGDCDAEEPAATTSHSDQNEATVQPAAGESQDAAATETKSGCSGARSCGDEFKIEQ